MEIINSVSNWIKDKIFVEIFNKDKHFNTIKTYEVLILGEKGVGKTSMCKKFSSGDFSLEEKPTTFTNIIISIFSIMKSP